MTQDRQGRQDREQRKYVPAVGPKLLKLLFVVFGLFALLSINSVYLAGISIAEWTSGDTLQNYFYQFMFLAHLALGLLILVPFVVYGVIHIANAHNRPNRRAVKVGYGLFITALLLLLSGLLLTRGVPLLELRDPHARDLAYWIHVVTPLVVAWLFVLHRLAGKRINWRVGGVVAAFAFVLALILIAIQSQDPRQWNVQGPEDGQQYFFPSLARTATGNFIPASTLMKDQYCRDCHADSYASWEHSMHRFASFNNPAYLFSVRGTREFALSRDGNVQAARFCAGCHDPVPFFSGAFDDPEFDDVNHVTSQAGITCTSCHAITHVNSNRGNADYTIEEPLHYPFVDSKNLAWLNRFLIKAKPEFHKKTFLKPLHKTPEFCGACHKVHLPKELNAYKWLRGQNHYDSFLLSGVSGHSVSSFYYPEKAEKNCNDCHMALQDSEDFGAQDFAGNGTRQVHDHQFPSANTAIPYLLSMPAQVNENHELFLQDSLRVDIFGLKEGGNITDPLIAPLRPEVPVLEPGMTYQLETVIRTLRLGHVFTQGTADSNQVWLDVMVRSGDRLLGHSGQLGKMGRVDPWSHFVNSYVLDKDGARIDRRNAEDIFTTLYNNQIPPGAADSVHYKFTLPSDVTEAVEIIVKLRYRKFDTRFMQYFQGDSFKGNDLPIITIAQDQITLPVLGATEIEDQQSSVDVLERWYDYGIGLFRKRGNGELRQAEEAFRQVESLGGAVGSLGLARVYFREGRLDDAVSALSRVDESQLPWTVTYYTGLVNAQNGFLDQAIENFKTLVQTQFNEARQRGFDFSKDYILLNKLAQTLFERSKLERKDDAKRKVFLEQAASYFKDALVIDSENAASHYGLAQVLASLGDEDGARRHRELHSKYKVDDNARDRAIAVARSADPAADRAANAVVIYDLQRHD